MATTTHVAKRPKAALSVSDCDREIERCQEELAAAPDDVSAAICRFEIDRWLDRRLVLMRYAA